MNNIYIIIIVVLFNDIIDINYNINVTVHIGIYIHAQIF